MSLTIIIAAAGATKKKIVCSSADNQQLLKIREEAGIYFAHAYGHSNIWSSISFTDNSQSQVTIVSGHMIILLMRG